MADLAMTHENILSQIISELNITSGDEFFNTLTLQLHKVIGADYTFIARLDKEKNVSRTISLVAKGDIAENFEYSLEFTPCADVFDDSTCVYPNNICSFYPQDQLLIDMKIEGYIGAPLHSSSGQVMGLVVALYEKPIVNESLTRSLFELFSGRISAEIEREEQQQELKDLNNNLESKVAHRTKELSDTLENLKATQDKMIAQERLASLGAMVAGVAHEINTPLGVAMLSGTNITDIAHSLNAKVEAQSLSKNDLISALADITDSGDALTHNLRRAADLVANFKQVAVERNISDHLQININQWLETQISSLRPLMKQHGLKINLHLSPQSIIFKTYPSKLSQVLVNIAQNAAVHAYSNMKDNREKQLTITVEESSNELLLSIADNGLGIPAEIQNKVFDPFFTTKRNAGGTGLGLSIVHSIVTGTLEGKIDLKSDEKNGTQFIISLPIN